MANLATLAILHLAILTSSLVNQNEDPQTNHRPSAIGFSHLLDCQRTPERTLRVANLRKKAKHPTSVRCHQIYRNDILRQRQFVVYFKQRENF